MAFISFTQGAAMYDVTPIENMFLLEYMPGAPEDFLRVYLYARMLCLHPELGSGEDAVAQALNMDNQRVRNAFDYWEQQGLMMRVADQPPQYAMLPMRTSAPDVNAPMEREYYEYRGFNAQLQALFPHEPLRPAEYRRANDWLNILGFTQDAVIAMVESEVKKSRTGMPDPGRIFRKLDKVMLDLADRGAKTAEDIRRALAVKDGVRQCAQQLRRRLSLNHQPTEDELKIIQKWMTQWNFTEAQIMDACAETVKAREPSIAYLDAILKSRKDGSQAGYEAAKAVLADLGADVRPGEEHLKRLGALLERGFEEGCIRLAAVQLNMRGKHTFDELEWLLGKWAEQGVLTQDAAQANIQRFQQMGGEVRALLEKAGSDKKPTFGDVSLLEKWKKTYGADLIDYAAEQARGTQLPMRYMDKLLEKWAQAGIQNSQQARDLCGQKPSACRVKERPVKENPALAYTQRNYTDEELADIFYDPTRDDKLGGNT